MTDHQPDEYFELARSWAVENDERERKSSRRAWLVAGVAAFVASIEGLALFALVPLKTTETVMMLVDRNTGYVERIDPNDASLIRADEALLQSMLAQYVTARERFDHASVQDDYRKASLWSAGSARRAYAAEMASSSPSNPFNRLPQGQSVAVEVKSVTKIDRDRALVRFDTFLDAPGGQREPFGSWISFIEFHFSDGAMSFEDRLLNPLGLQVTMYRRDAERPTDQPGAVGGSAVASDRGFEDPQ
ncbi:virB8 family protein [Erythrobacter aureus]|uniref:virB8 family protein n=1 Tax=Erythrobacter aureus TaxID=2182384 RepID=UPI003A8CE002